MTAEAPATEPSATDFLALTPRDVDIAALQTLRHAGAERFRQVGLPGSQDESWRFTNLKPLKQTRFHAPPEAPPALGQEDIANFLFPNPDGTVLVFIDGVEAPDLIHRVDQVPGLTLLPLAEAARQGEPQLLAHLGHHITVNESPFAALNAATFDSGVFIHIEREACIKTPIVLLYISTATDQPWVTQPRNLIVCDEASEVTVVEHHVSLHGGPALTNVVTEIDLAEGAVACHYRVDEESDAAFHIATLGIHQAAQSRFESHCMLLGGGLVRNHIHPVLDGAGCHCLLNGLYVGNGRQHLDSHMRVDHVQPGCDSRQYYKGVLDDHARGVFSGRIHVTSAAQQTDAKQSNATLLLSEDATNHAQPQLEIYADDVKCTHGATVGQIDDDAIFYLRARGIHPEAARAMMIYAHAAECLERMAVEPLRHMLSQRLLQKMPWNHGLG